MKRTLLLTIMFAGSAPLALRAQEFVRPAAPIDARRAGIRDHLLVLRDSLNTVNSSAARLQRDFRSTSLAALSGRARSVAAACASSARVVPAARSAVASASPATPMQGREQSALLHSLDSLSATLDRCSTDFTAMGERGNGEEVRGYGNRRAEPILAQLGRYDDALTRFFAAWGIEVRPIGARPNPVPM